MLDPRSSRASIHIRIDSEIKEPAVNALTANGMTISGAVTAMARIGIKGTKISFEISGKPEIAECGISDDEATEPKIEKNRTSDRTMIGKSPEEKRGMRRCCKAMAIAPNAAALFHMAQIAFELREPIGL